MRIKIHTFYIILIMITLGCEKPNPLVQKENLAGYWEIKSVTMPDGTEKNFGINALIDFIEVSGDSGVRTKVAPKFDGSFANNGSAEKFSIKIENDSLRLYYETPFDTWAETVLSAKDSALVVRNRDNKVYSYIKFKKFNFEE